MNTPVNSTLAQAIAEISNDEYMSQRQIAAFQTKLLADLGVLQAGQDSSLSELRDQGRPADYLDVSQEQGEINMVHARANQRKAMIAQIRKALAYIKSGDYGYCDSCGLPIGLPRLIARPTSILDADCATLAELKLQKELSLKNPGQVYLIG